jgi:hypothetical protein
VSAAAEIRSLLARCHDDPDLFNATFLGRGKYWWQQVRICRSLVKHKTTVVVSGNATGKDYTTGGIVPWWLLTRPRSMVFVTGPSQTVIGTVTWKEIRRAVNGARTKSGKRINLGIRVSEGAKASPLMADLGEGWAALGFSTTSIERASGHHAAHLLVVVNEASSREIDNSGVWEAIRGLNPEKVLVLGNPLYPDGRFRDLVKRAERERNDPRIPECEKVNVIVIPSTDSPDIHLPRSPRGLADKGFLDEAEREYGRDSLWWLSHVDAQFPDSATDLLVKPAWVDRMASVQRADKPGGRRRMGVDLGEGTGRDSSFIVICDELGILHAEGSERMGIPEAATAINRLMVTHGVRQEDVVYDAGGRGKDLWRYLEQFHVTDAVPYHGSGKGGFKFANKRSRMAWTLRQRLDPERPMPLPAEPVLSAEDRKIRESPFYVAPPKPKNELQPPFALPADRPWWPRLSEEIKGLRYHMDGDKIALEKKEDFAKRLGRSPDVCDAFLMTFAVGREL